MISRFGCLSRTQSNYQIIVTFSLGSIKEIEWDDGAFESLVLPHEYKELILALTESEVENKDEFDDVIQGKGKGMIMLLSGPPGVGKTLTAESGTCVTSSALSMVTSWEI